MQQLLAILEDSTGSMQGTQEDPAAGSRAARQAWWAERQALDARMQALLQDMQTSLGPWRWVPAVCCLTWAKIAITLAAGCGSAWQLMLL